MQHPPSPVFMTAFVGSAAPDTSMDVKSRFIADTSGTSVTIHPPSAKDFSVTANTPSKALVFPATKASVALRLSA